MVRERGGDGVREYRGMGGEGVKGGDREGEFKVKEDIK